MATLTKTITENEGNAKATWTITLTGTDRKVTGATFYAPTFSVSAKYVYAYKNHASFNLLGIEASIGSERDYVGEGDIYNAVWNSGTAKSVPITWNTQEFLTANVFNSSNKTTRTVNVSYVNVALSFWSYQDDLPINYGSWDSGGYNYNLGTLSTVTLDVPPTFSETFSYTGDFSGVPYAGLTTANVSLSSLTAYYGGDFTGVGKAEFTIGSQTVSKANPVNSDVLSIPLNAVGTFTPTVKVTDSRGQVTTHTLSAITVQGYVAPSVAFSVERTTATGTPDDEGVYAVITPTFTFTDAIATLVAPTIAVTDDGGTTQTVITTWYSTRASDGTLSGSVTWANLASGDTVYGLVSITGDFNTQKSYQIAVTPEDSQGTGTTITQTLGSAFYTVDFYAGGHGIAFGQPASQDGFFCNMDAHFVDKADVMRALFDFIHPVGSYYETSDTSFDPNVTWGGTWQLEVEGQVHISAGANYAVSGALTDTTDGGSKDAIIPYHNHGFTQPTISAHSHKITDDSWNLTSNASSGFTRSNAGSGSAVTNVIRNTASNGAVNRGGNSTQNATPTASGGAVHYAGTDGNINNANMQPYIIVNRWHRTA